jgi:High-affinity nickel-transport protein
MLLSLLALGFLLGLKHALEADHVAAVAQLAARSASWRQTARVAGAWGVGHAGVLVLFGSIVVLLGTQIPERVASGLEAGVGVMLIVLGVGVVRRLRRERIHLHMHRHGEGPAHLHLHQHPGALDEHEHAHGLMRRGLLIGSIHGLAGTAALVLLAVPTMSSGTGSLLYLVTFGAGTVAGMVLFSLALSIPLTFSLKRVRHAAIVVEVTLAVANVALGGWIVASSLA